jgi:hypothetical protein
MSQVSLSDKVGRLLHAAKEDLSQLGQCVNNGFFDQADIYTAKMIDHHRCLSAYARGWRLADPIEGLRNRLSNLRKAPEPPLHEFDLTDDQMQQVMTLVHKRATTQAQNRFVVHPPQKLLDNPALAESDNVIEEFADSIFEVVFQDGTYAMLSLPELMTFTYQLIFLAHQCVELERMFKDSNKPADVKVSLTFAVPEIMRPEIVKALLSKIEFSKEASDGPAAHKAGRIAS